MATVTAMPRRVGHRLWGVIVVEVLVALNALYGGVGLMWGNRIGLLDEWLVGTPFPSWTLPGALLLLVVAAPMAVAALLEVRRSAWAWAASVAAGAAQIGWIAAQLAVVARREGPLWPQWRGPGR